MLEELSAGGVQYGPSRGQSQTEGFGNDVKVEMKHQSNFVIARILKDWLKYKMEVDDIYFSLISESSVFVSKDLIRLVLRQNGIMTAKSLKKKRV